MSTSYKWDFGNNDNTASINAYWLSKKLDLGNIPTLKRIFFTEVITNNADLTLQFQQRQNWETTWSSAITLTDSQEKHVLTTDWLGNLIQYKLTDNSTSTIFEIVSI